MFKWCNKHFFLTKLATSVHRDYKYMLPSSVQLGLYHTLENQEWVKKQLNKQSEGRVLIHVIETGRYERISEPQGEVTETGSPEEVSWSKHWRNSKAGESSRWLLRVDRAWIQGDTLVSRTLWGVQNVWSTTAKMVKALSWFCCIVPLNHKQAVCVSHESFVRTDTV